MTGQSRVFDDEDAALAFLPPGAVVTHRRGGFFYTAKPSAPAEPAPKKKSRRLSEPDGD